MLTDLAVSTFRRVENTSERSICNGDYLPTKEAIPRLTSLEGILGPEYKNLRYFLRVESTGFLAKKRGELLNRIREISGVPRSSWKDTVPILENLWERFFGMGLINPRWPGFVVVMPRGYVTTRHQSRLRSEIGGMPNTEYIDRPRTPESNLSFSPFLKKFDIPINFEFLRLKKPPGHEDRWARPVVRVLTRSYYGLDGCALPEDHIFQISRASPDDEANLLNGGYYPVTEGLRILDSQGKNCFTRGLMVLVIARLVPGRSYYDSAVHQITVTLSEDASEILDINCLWRDFGRFAEHYPGILDLLVDQLKP